MSANVQALRGEVVPSLADEEAVIRKGLSTFIDVGRALAHIRDRRLYVKAGFDTFDEYCKRRWDMGRSNADKQIGAAEVAAICGRSSAEAPTSSWVAHPLVKVLNEYGEQAVVEAWSQITARHEGDGPVGGSEVRRFLTIPSGGGKPGWNELLGMVGDALTLATKHMDKAEAAITRRPNERLRENIGVYRKRGAALVERLAKMEDAA